jgi:hypothetical protein
MLSVVLAIVAAACFIFMLIALSYAFDLAEKLERVEAELEECRRRNPSNPNRAGLKLVKGGGRVQGRG